LLCPSASFINLAGLLILNNLGNSKSVDIAR